MLWKKGHLVLTLGTMNNEGYKRPQEVTGEDRTPDIHVHDGGMYRCEIEQDNNLPLAVVHTLKILGERT